jgi:hypothetical protein
MYIAGALISDNLRKLWIDACRAQMRAAKGNLSWSKVSTLWRAVAEASRGYPHDQKVYEQLALAADLKNWNRNRRPTCKIKR